jgi:hypothetical protein
MLTDRGTRRNAYRLADRKAALHRAPAYMYISEFPSPAYGGKFGAVHATDVPLVFHNTEGQRMTGNSPESRRVADQMAAAWVAFANTGNPNHAGIPNWPTYTPDQQQTMIFNQTSHVENACRSPKDRPHVVAAIGGNSDRSAKAFSTRTRSDFERGTSQQTHLTRAPPASRQTSPHPLTRPDDRSGDASRRLPARR